MAYQSGNVWKARVYDKGSGQFVTMCEQKNGEWVDCTFPTEEAAKQAEREYKEFWKDT